MTTLFSRIIEGELPARFVWKDDICVAFLSIAPLKPGHTLVVPRAEVDHWIDLPTSAMMHLSRVAQCVGRAIQDEWQPTKVGTTILGLEVPHVHIHVVPIWEPRDLDFDNADANAREADLDEAALRLRAAIRRRGHTEASD
ncbi:MAG: HIT family protein [Myxococcota bacterium]